MPADFVLEDCFPRKRIADVSREDDLRRASGQALVVLLDGSVIDLRVRHDRPRPNVDPQRTEVIFASVAVSPLFILVETCVEALAGPRVNRVLRTLATNERNAHPRFCKGYFEGPIYGFTPTN